MEVNKRRHSFSTNMAGIYVLCLILSAIGFLIHLYLRYHYKFWKRRQVPDITPKYFVGNLGSMLMMRKSPADCINDLYNDCQAKNQPFVGFFIFYKPAIFLREPELIKRILIKDFSKFCNRYSCSDTKGDPLGSQNIFFLKNPHWKEVRLKLSPFFTSNKIRQMFQLIEDVGRDLNAHLLAKPLDNKDLNCFTVELKELCALYTTDVIATVAYGVEANTLKNPLGEFRYHGREVFRFNLKRAIVFIIVFFLPHLVPILKFKVVPTEQTVFLRNTINHIMKQRELSGKSRNDLIDILIEFKKSSKLVQHTRQINFEGDILVAQAALFFTAGFESSSATMSFALYELAKRRDLQERLRNEIKDALIKYSGQVTYQLIDSLELMQMVIYEVLRMYPPLPFLDRECTVPNSSGYSLKPFNSYEIPNGMPVYIPVYGIHMDPQYYPNPEYFNPDRFAPENKKNLVPYTYMPFGLGPHACIGERFAMLQTKIGLLYFLLNHYVAVGSKTKAKMTLDPKAIIIQSKGGIYLNVVRDPLKF